MTQLETWIAEARAEGVHSAKAAASWVVDGNTTPQHIARMIAWLDDGDSRADEYLPNRPDLSGEFDSDDTPIRLYERITARDHSEAEDAAGMAYETLVGSIVEALANAWEEAVSETFPQECERILRASLPGPDSECGECGHQWNSVLEPTPAARCPNEYEHEDR